jgi:hypothetical protein
VITGRRHNFVQLCARRGYSLQEVSACIKSDDGDLITVDETHPAYPRAPRPKPPGPGAELKALLKALGIVAKPGCSCNKRARIMDEKGCDWCEANIATISDWLREEARKRRLPYLDIAGIALIRRAIKRARRLEVGMHRQPAEPT